VTDLNKDGELEVAAFAPVIPRPTIRSDININTPNREWEGFIRRCYWVFGIYNLFP